MEQKVFVDGKINTLSCQSPRAEALFVSGANVVLASSNSDVLGLVNGEYNSTDLLGQSVYPTFFDSEINVYKIIKQRLKNAKINKNNIKNASKTANSENFYNLDAAIEELKNVQRQLICLGITTIFEVDIDVEEFEFWKRASELDVLQVDVIGYVNFKSSKSVMDENCRSFRKYKNHFRLGGYYVELDGKLEHGGAWVSRAYRRTSHYGHNELVDEELEFIIKTALEEKKQLVVSASGDRAVEQFIRCYQNIAVDVEDNYRPYLTDLGLISGRQLKKLAEHNIGLRFDYFYRERNVATLKKVLGNLRCRNLINLKKLVKSGSKFMVGVKLSEFEKFKQILFGEDEPQTNRELLIDTFVKDPAHFGFDDIAKGSLESGKLANFVVLDSENTVVQVYVEGECVYKK